MAIVLSYEGSLPELGRDVFLAPTATVIGDVVLGDEASVWFGAVLRADVGAIRVGARSNVQDLACLHLTESVSSTRVGADVTIGHGAILHGCTVGDGCLIGMGCIILDGAQIGEGSVVAAGALVSPGTIVPPRSLVKGSPAKVVGPVRPEQAELGRSGAAHYVELARRYAAASAAGERDRRA